MIPLVKLDHTEPSLINISCHKIHLFFFKKLFNYDLCFTLLPLVSCMLTWLYLLAIVRSCCFLGHSALDRTPGIVSVRISGKQQEHKINAILNIVPMNLVNCTLLGRGLCSSSHWSCLWIQENDISSLYARSLLENSLEF